MPQMGAAVEIFGLATGQHQLAYTDAKGYFSLNGLLPGSYDLRASAPSFLPTLREDVALAAGATKVLNITLNTLFEAVKMLPPPKQSAAAKTTVGSGRCAPPLTVPSCASMMARR